MKEFIFKDLKNDIEFQRRLDFLTSEGWQIISTEPTNEKSIKIIAKYINY